ncbi:NaeI family type II restriction endonuclease [Streptomyces sp. 1331.2]|uniref:NaeI family type II restriction endonuclease n=1 Tax=Streptomyces sp. 1331.2 TaxID=1938835 RepID=UPI000BCE1F52|nr:NaeI family type II restriction endonuclease [Streptomyces sp. 1331.2]SOB88669.1 Predicted nucleic acid-binding protein, contains Zn-ribbon domain [Streptomyces sp. 1331.2]
MANQDGAEIDLSEGEWLPQPRGARTMIFQKDVDPTSVSPESYALAIELRALAQRVGTSLNAYARRVNWDRSTISRYLSGVLVPPADFVERLILDGDRHLGVELTVDARTLVHRLQREALRAASPTSADIQDLRDELAEAERHSGLLQQETRLLRDMLKAAHSQLDEQEVQIRAIERSAAADRLTQRAELAVWSTNYEGLRSERDRLQSLLDKLKHELVEAERRAATAEERCAALERQLEAAEEAEDEEWEELERRTQGPVSSSASSNSPTFSAPYKANDDTDLQAVVLELERQDPVGQRMASILVAAMDRVIDGPRTGRFHLGQISALERSSLHAITANLIQHEFGFPDGHPTDFLVAGIQVRYRFSTLQGWGIPASALNQVCLLVEVGEEGRHWNMGIVRATPEHLGSYGNRDGKRHLSATGVSAVRWLHREAMLPISVMADLPAATLENITCHKNAQVRVDNLFRSIQGRPIDRQTIVALARSAIHGERRARESRARLVPEGILVLTLRDDQLISDLQLPALGPSQWLSIRLVRMQPDHGSTPSTLLAGERWCAARLQDPIEELPMRRY